MAESSKKASPRIKININNQITQVDKFFLDALALSHFSEKYEDKEIKKKTRRLVREIIKNKPVSVQVVQQKILESFLPQSIQKQLEE